MTVNNKLLALLIPLWISGCSEPPFYEEYIAVNNNAWHADSTASFDVEIEDTSSAYIIYINLRNNSSYPFSNIFLFREISSSRGIEFRDTVEYILADQYGKWTGKGLGELKTNSWPYKTSELRFNKPGVYTFSIQQAMRVGILEGIEDIGMSVYKANTQQQNNGKKEASK